MKKLSLVPFIVIMVWQIAWSHVEEKKPIAKVGKHDITLFKFKEKYRPSGDMNRDSLKQVVIDDLIADKVLLIDAYAKGFDKQVEEQVKPYKNRLMIGKLYECVVVKRANVPLWLVKNEWRKRGITLRVSQITVNDKAALRNVYNELRRGVEFAEVARKYSTDYQAKQGGEIGEVRWGQLESKVQRVVFSLKPNEVSRPVKIRDEYRILKLHERKEVKGRDFKREKDMLEGDLKRKYQTDLANKYLEHLRKIAHIKYNLPVIEEVSKCTDSVTVDKDKVLVSWTGGKITMGEFVEKAGMDIKTGRFTVPEAIKDWLSNHLNFEILLPHAGARYRFDRLPDIGTQLTDRIEFLMLREYQAQHIDSVVTVTEEELVEYFEAHRIDYGGEAASFEQMESRVRWDVEREKRQLKRAEIVQELKSRIPIEIYWDNIKEL